MGLIETWDVLKFIKCIPLFRPVAVINRNMGCIEIIQQGQSGRLRVLINRNMGCIEIRTGEYMHRPNHD